MMAINNPHFDLPFRRSTRDSAVVCVEQDSDKDVLNCVHAVVRYPIGFRSEPDDFGVDELLFQTSPDTSGLLQQVSRWESRSTLTLMDEIFDVAEATLRARIGVD
jgi:hypothetical protein